MRPRYTRDARRQLRAIGDYIAEEHPAAAKRVVARIRSAAELIANFPKIGRPGRVRGTREWSVRGLRYILVYEIAGETVSILQIIHTAQDR